MYYCDICTHLIRYISDKSCSVPHGCVILHGKHLQVLGIYRKLICNIITQVSKMDIYIKESSHKIKQNLYKVNIFNF